MPSALDMSLDEVIESSWDKDKSKGKGRGSGKGKGREGKASKLNMSLDEIVETTFGREGKGKGKGRDEDGWKGARAGKGGASSFGKSFGKGKGTAKGAKGASWGQWGEERSGFTPSWMEHDDWRGEEEEDDGAWRRPAPARGKGGADDDWRAPGRGPPAAPVRRSWADFEDRGDERRSWGAPALAWREAGPASRLLDDRGRRPAVQRSVGVGGSSGSWQRIEQDDDDDEPPRREAPRPVKRPRVEEEDRRPRTKAKVTTKAATKRIKVTNVPKQLKARDIQEAFEAETGKTTSCELEKGTAFITFARAEDARKAVETFDKGELNGKIITVVLDP